MTLVMSPTEIYLPNVQVSSGGGLGLDLGETLDVDGDTGGAVFQISDRDDGKTIDKLGVLVESVTTTGDVDARVETVSLTDGFPTGTLATTNSNKVQSISAAGWNEFALTAGHVVATGDLISIVFVLGSTPSANIRFNSVKRSMAYGQRGFQYSVKKLDPSAFAKIDPAINHVRCYGVGFSDGTWMHQHGLLPLSGIGSTSLTSTGTAEAGWEFQIPFKATLSGIVAQVNQAGNISVHVGNGSYNPGDTGATRLSTRDFDKDVRALAAQATTLFRLDTPVDLDINTTYRVVIDAITTTAVTLPHMDFDEAALIESVGYSTSFKHISDNGAGGWTTTTTRAPLIALAFSRFDDGAGGGGTVNLLRGKI